MELILRLERRVCRTSEDLPPTLDAELDALKSPANRKEPLHRDALLRIQTIATVIQQVNSLETAVCSSSSFVITDAIAAIQEAIDNAQNDQNAIQCTRLLFRLQQLNAIAEFHITHNSMKSATAQSITPPPGWITLMSNAIVHLTHIKNTTPSSKIYLHTNEMTASFSDTKIKLSDLLQARVASLLTEMQNADSNATYDECITNIMDLYTPRDPAGRTLILQIVQNHGFTLIPPSNNLDYFVLDIRDSPASPVSSQSSTDTWYYNGPDASITPRSSDRPQDDYPSSDFEESQGAYSPSKADSIS